MPFLKSLIMNFPDLNLISFIIQTNPTPPPLFVDVRLHEINYKYKEWPIHRCHIYGVEYAESLIDFWDLRDIKSRDLFTVDNKFKDVVILPNTTRYTGYIIVPIVEERFLLSVFLSEKVWKNILEYKPTPDFILKKTVYFKYPKGKSLINPTCSILTSLGVVGDADHKRYLETFRSYKDLKIVTAKNVEPGKIYVSLRDYLIPGLSKNELLKRSIVFGNTLYGLRLSKPHSTIIKSKEKKCKPFYKLPLSKEIEQNPLHKEALDVFSRKGSELFLKESSKKLFIEIEEVDRSIKQLFKKAPILEINALSYYAFVDFVTDDKDLFKKVSLDCLHKIKSYPNSSLGKIFSNIILPEKASVVRVNFSKELL